ncbi:DUF5069 domain-containing protein [Candidatus Poribacteria bacterium]|nr:DUF5069 domain-containing protein [Candidatus Poribacteria bacterium]
MKTETKVSPCSPTQKTKGMFWFARMLDKIRLHAEGKLHEDYIPWLGKGMDGICLGYLRLNYDNLVERTLEGGTDEELLEWCFANGRELSHEDIAIFNGFARKVGLRDPEKVTSVLIEAKRQCGLEHREDIDTVFKCIEVDEGREP